MRYDYKFSNDELYQAIAEKKSVTEMAQMFNVNRSSIHKRLRKLGIVLYNYHNEAKFNEEIFDCIDTEEKAYWFGFIYADGYVSDGNRFEISLKGGDTAHLNKFNSFMEYRGNNVSVGIAKCEGKEFSRCRWSVANAHLVKTLKSYGLIPRKSLVMTFPDTSIFASEDLIRPFIRGLFDANGCLYTSKGRYYIQYTGTENIIDNIIKYVSTGSKAKAYKRPNGICSYSLSGEYANAFCRYLYDNSSIHLDRKYSIYKLAVSQSNLRYNNGVKTVKAEMPIPC